MAISGTALGMMRKALIVVGLAYWSFGCTAYRGLDLPQKDIEDAIAAVLIRANSQTGPYCLRVFDRAPRPLLARRLQKEGQEIVDCNEETDTTVKIERIAEGEDGLIELDHLLYGGPLAQWGTRFYLRRNDRGEMIIVRAVDTVVALRPGDGGLSDSLSVAVVRH